MPTDLGFPLRQGQGRRPRRRPRLHRRAPSSTTRHAHPLRPESLVGLAGRPAAQAHPRADASRVPAWRAGAPARCWTSPATGRSRPTWPTTAMDLFPRPGAPARRPEGVEHTATDVRVLRLDRADGPPLSAWTHFPVHLTTSPRQRAVGRRPRRHRHGTAAPGRGEHDHHATSQDAGFTALYANGARATCSPVRRVEPAGADRPARAPARRRGAPAWRDAGTRLRADLPVDVRFTKPATAARRSRRRQPVSLRAGLRAALPRRLRGRRVDLLRAAGRPRASAARPRSPTRCRAARSWSRRARPLGVHDHGPEFTAVRGSATG